MSDIIRASHPRWELLRAASRLLSTALSWGSMLGRRAFEPLYILVYRVYAWHLASDVLKRPLPEHMAMILDGNRRFARSQGLSDPTEGYRYGASKVGEVIGWCDELSIPVVTLWGLSTDNLERSQEELSALFESLGDQLEELGRYTAGRPGGRRIQIVGRRELLPDQLRRQIDDVERLTASWGPGILNVAIAYGGRDEILDAVRRLLRTQGAAGDSVSDIADTLSTETLHPYLYAPDMPEPDLIIRTSGEVRLSGFLLWQSVYSELYFCDAPWPAFRQIDFLRGIRSYQVRRRRSGR